MKQYVCSEYTERKQQIGIETSLDAAHVEVVSFRLYYCLFAVFRHNGTI